MKLAYVTTYDVLNSSSWPKYQVGLCGAGYYLAQALEKQSVAIDYISSFKKKVSPVTKAKWSFYRYLLKKDYYRWAEPLVLRNYAHQISQKLPTFNSNIVLCPENAVPIAYLECQQPIVLWTDSALIGLIDVYPYLSNLCNETKRNIYALEKAALNQCQLIVYWSDWAAQTAIKNYGIDASKVKVVPAGANIECNRTLDDISHIIDARTANYCKLLFFGFDWIRKGGNVALEVAKQLNQMGFNAELTVVGSPPPTTDEPLPSFVKFLGFISKSTPEGEQKINQLLAESHFLILPSQAECYGIVFCEANSFGVPCLATNVGGIPTIIKDNVNGKTFSLDANVSEYCNYIASLMTNYNEYKQLALSSFNEYQSRLNWDVAGKTVKNLLLELV